MASYRCEVCGGALTVANGAETAVCEYCGNTVTLPKANSAKLAVLYDRAGHYREAHEFDRAIGIYESILNEDGKEAEAYWGKLLCAYGIEYVKDPKTLKYIPTCHRVNETPITADGDYKCVLQYASAYNRSIYEGKAKAIEAVQRGILEISKREQPYDVFICYKEKSAADQRTKDSVLAQELYQKLTDAGLRVFFSRITMQEHAGEAYEPYIYAALSSAHVMVTVSTQRDYIEAPWVKNEWSRFLAMKDSGSSKTLIPAYAGMSPYDLPDEFAYLQAVDLQQIGAMQDIVFGAKKLVDAARSSIANDAPVKSLEKRLKHGFMCVEDGKWEEADAVFKAVLLDEPESGMAYLGRLLCEFHAVNIDDLRYDGRFLENMTNYKRALQFCPQEVKEKLCAKSHKILKEKQDECLKEIEQEIERANHVIEHSNTVVHKLKAKVYKFPEISKEKISKEEKELQKIQRRLAAKTKINDGCLWLVGEFFLCLFVWAFVYALLEASGVLYNISATFTLGSFVGVFIALQVSIYAYKCIVTEDLDVVTKKLDALKKAEWEICIVEKAIRDDKTAIIENENWQRKIMNKSAYWEDWKAKLMGDASCASCEAYIKTDHTNMKIM